MNIRHAVVLGSLLLSACAFGGRQPGITAEGAVVVVAASTVDAARRLAVRGALDLFLAPSSTMSAAIAESFSDRSAEFIRRERFKKGNSVIELRFVKFLQALDKEGLLRPEGFTALTPRVLLLVSESQSILDLGVGPSADALRRGLLAQGLTAIDGRDPLNNFSASGQGPAALLASAARLGANWMIVADTSASAEFDAVTQTWRGRASFRGDQFVVKSTTPVQMIESEASVLEISSAAARSKALDQAGMEAATKIAETITRRRSNRSEGALLVAGGADLDRLKALLAIVRGIEGVAGAYLGVWRGEEESVVLRLFMTGLKTDDLAARLIRRDPSLSVLSVEPDSGRLAVEIR